MIKDLTGAWRSWIEIGAPDAARLHQASKASPRVALYTHKEPRILMRGYEGQRIHRAEEVEIYAVERDFLASLAGHLDRRTEWALSVTDGRLFLDGTITEIGAGYFTFEGTIRITDTPDPGRQCEDNKSWHFAVTQNRPYYRLREFEWCDGLTDYIDIYF